MYIYITQGRFNNHTARRLYRIMVTAAIVVRVMKMGNIVPQAGIEHTIRAFWASMLTIMLPRFIVVTTALPCLYGSLPERSGYYRIQHPHPPPLQTSTKLNPVFSFPHCREAGVPRGVAGPEGAVPLLCDHATELHLYATRGRYPSITDRHDWHHPHAKAF